MKQKVELKEKIQFSMGFLRKRKDKISHMLAIL